VIIIVPLEIVARQLWMTGWDKIALRILGSRMNSDRFTQNVNVGSGVSLEHPRKCYGGKAEFISMDSV
jgi:hypothetical protein